MPAARPDIYPPAGDDRRSERSGARAASLARAISLHARLVARDEAALAELIEETTPWLLGVAMGLLSDSTEAEEVVQEVFTVVWNRVGQVRNEPPGLLAWMLQIARNRAIDRLRSRKAWLRKATRLAAEGLDVAAFVAAEEPNEAATPGWHVHRSVHTALAALPPEQQLCVRLAYFEGLTHSSIAQLLGIPLGTVKTRLRLAFDKLRLALAPMKDWII
jgi:RNA polymerase sigma-70 factor (ECF subfamily)